MNPILDQNCIKRIDSLDQNVFQNHFIPSSSEKSIHDFFIGDPYMCVNSKEFRVQNDHNTEVSNYVSMNNEFIHYLLLILIRYLSINFPTNHQKI
jgi:hypothetical protein